MVAAESPMNPHPVGRPKPSSGRRPLQPKNIILPHSKPIKQPISSPMPIIHHCCQANIPISPIPMDASLAEELSAVKRKLERLRLEREKTENLLQKRDRALDLHMVELQQRGEFQRELEMEVDRLYRLNQLKLASMRRSPIRSLREKEMEKKIQEPQSEVSKVGESKEEMTESSSSTENSPLSSESTLASTSATKSNSTSTSATTFNSTLSSTSSSTSASTSRKSPVPLRWSIESPYDE